MAQTSEEEICLLVELSGIIDNDFLYKTESPCSILGVDSENPILQIGHYIFSGEYKDALGSVAVFEEHKNIPKQTGNISESKITKGLKLKHIVNKKLIMKRAFLQEKTKEEKEKENITIDDVIMVEADKESQE